MAINMSARNRIIVIDTFFAIPFSDLFRLKINSNFLPIDLLTNVTFKLRKRLLNERIRDHITHLKRMFCVSELSQAHLRDIRFHWRIWMQLRTPKTVRRMFGATKSYLFFLVLQLVGRWKEGWTRRQMSPAGERSI